MADKLNKLPHILKNLDENSVLRKSPGAASRIIDGEAVIVLPEAGMVRVLNEAGSFIWEAIDGKNKISEISRALTQKFEVSKGKALTDTKEFIAVLISKKMADKVKE